MAEEMVNTLKIAGLTEYEVKVYLALVTSGNLTASELSEKSKVPYSRIYDIISKLEEKGWVEVEEGRPIRVFTKNPDMTLGKAIKSINEQLEYALRHLKSLYVSRPKMERALVITINGWERTKEMLVDMLQEARSEVMIMFGFLSNLEKQTILEALKELSRKPVKIRAVVRSDSELVAEIKDFEKYCEIHYTDRLPQFRMNIIDWKMALVAFPRMKKDGDFNFDDVTTLRLSHPGFLSLIKYVASVLWEESKLKA